MEAEALSSFSERARAATGIADLREIVAELYEDLTKQQEIQASIEALLVRVKVLEEKEAV